MNDAALEKSGSFLLACSELAADNRMIAPIGLFRLKDLTVRMSVEREHRAASSDNFILY